MTVLLAGYQQIVRFYADLPQIDALDTVLVMGFNSVVHEHPRHLLRIPTGCFTLAGLLTFLTLSDGRSQIERELDATLEDVESANQIESIVDEWTDPSELGEVDLESIEYYGFDNEAADELELLDVAGEVVDERIFGDSDPEDKVGLLRYFGFSVRAGAEYDSSGGSGGSGEAIDNEGDLIFSLSPTIRLNSGGNSGSRASVLASYTPSALFYMNNSDRDRLNHHFNLNGTYQLPKTSIGVSANFSQSDTGDSYLGGGGGGAQVDDNDRFFEEQTNTVFYGLNLNLSHQLTGKSSLGYGLSYSGNLFDETGLDRNTLDTNASWQYQMTGKISAGPYVSAEWSDVEGGGDQTAYGLGTAIDYLVGAKTSISGSIGMENRSFSGEGSTGNKVFLTYSLDGGYAVTSKINLNTSLYRSVQPSYREVDEATASTGINFGAGYQYSERISTFLSLGYVMDEFLSTRENAAASRQDQDYFSVSLGANWSVGDHWTLGANYSWRRNSSDNSLQDFDSMVTGVSATFEF